MRITSTVTAGFGAPVAAVRDQLAAGVTDLVDRETFGMRDALRGEAERNFRRVSGGSRSVAKAIRARTYPDGTKTSLGPAGVVTIPWRLAEVFTDGVTIQGRPWLAIPTYEAQRLGLVSVQNRRRTSDVKAAIAKYGDRLHMIRDGANIVLAIEAGDYTGRRKLGSSFTDRRGRSRARTLVVLFTLVRRVALRPRLSPESVLDAAAGRVAAGIAQLGG